MNGVVKRMEREAKRVRLINKCEGWIGGKCLIVCQWYGAGCGVWGEAENVDKGIWKKCTYKILKVITTKRKIMQIGSCDEAEKNAWMGVVLVLGEKYEVVEEFEYLGILV